MAPVPDGRIASEIPPSETASEVPAEVADARQADHDHAVRWCPSRDRPGETASEVPTEAGAVAAAPTVETAAAPACGSRSVSKETAVGTLTLRDILAQLARPGRDPREDLPAPVFKQGVLKLEDLTPGMELTGTVLNVVDFGCFVDIGMHDSGLVHVSRLADRFIRDPHEVVAVGDIVKVWVMEVDKERRRVSLTMVRPGSERPRRPAPGLKDDSSQQDQQAGQGQASQDQAGQIRQRGQHGDRPPRSGQGRQGGRPGQQGGQPNQQGGRPQGGRPQGGRPQGGRPQARRCLRSQAAGRRAKAARAASLARTVAAMVVRRREDRGRKVPVRAALMSSSPSPNRSSRSPMP